MAGLFKPKPALTFTKEGRLMILVDKALAKRQQTGNPVRVAIVGAGYSGRNIAYQIIKSFPGLRLVAISNRTLMAAREAYSSAGVREVQVVE